MVQVEAGAISALLKVTEEPPGEAVVAAEDPQFESEAETGLANTTPVGR